MPDDDALPPISYDELIEKLSDPDADLDHYLRYMIEVTVPGRMAPELEPNPSLVTGIPPRVEGGVAMGLANWFMKRRRHRTYRRRIRDGWTKPRIVSEGDSWFQYPTSLQDIIDHLMKDHLILSLGAAGDELSDMIRQNEILLNIDAEGSKALLLSAGGNDLFDKGQLEDLVETPFPGAEAEDLVGPTLDAFLAHIKGQYLGLLRRVHAAFPHVHILVHGYGPAFPRGGSWIAKPLTRAGVPKAIQHDVVKLILVRFNAMLADLAQSPEFHGKLGHIDVTDIGTRPDQWHDEIHLDSPTYALVADRFRAELKRRLDAPVVESAVAAVPEPPSALEQQAGRLTALDQPTLLRELDLRVRLVSLDPSVGAVDDLPLLYPNRAEAEAGVASLRRATRRLIRHRLGDLRDVLCGGAEPGNLLEKAVVNALGEGRARLAGAIAAWLTTGPIGIPGAIATALAAWLAGEVLKAGKARFCDAWKPQMPALTGVAVEAASTPKAAELREMFRTPAGLPSFDADDVKDRLAAIEEEVAKKVVEPPQVPVDAQGARPFMRFAKTILERLGGDEAEFSPEEMPFVEAIVLTDGSRPALYVQDGTIDVTDEKLDRGKWREDIEAALPDIHRQIAATGRVIHGSDRPADIVFGTAWMLTDGRVATAQHVLEGIASQTSTGAWMVSPGFFVDFSVEAERPSRPEQVFPVESVAFQSPDTINFSVNEKQLDLAILQLAPNGLGDFPEPVPLAGEADGAELLAKSHPRFYNVGHPAEPFGTWLVDTEDGNDNTISRALLFALIGDRFGVKRFSPGMMLNKPGAFAQLGGAAASVYHHDATTLGGSSGSGIMMTKPSGGVMAGLHFAGLFGTRNYAHWVPAIRDAFDGAGGNA